MPTNQASNSSILWQQAAANAANTAMGIGVSRIGANYDRKQQLKTQEAMMGMQLRYNKEWLDYENQQNLELYSPEAEKKRLKEAGLNPGLMYGMSGPGATTMASGGGMGAPTAGVINTTPQMGMGINVAEMQLAKAQIENIKANTNKTNVEAGKIGGVDTELANQQIQNLIQNVKSEKAKQALTEIQTKLTNYDANFLEQTMDDRIKTVHANYNEAMGRAKSAEAEGEISYGTMQEAMQAIRTDATNKILESALIEAQTANTQQSTEESKQRVQQSKEQINKWAQEISQEWSSLDRQERELKLKTFEAEIRAAFPGIGNALGKILNGAMDEISKLTTGKDSTYRQEYKVNTQKK